MADIINYEMTAYDQKDSFNTVQKEMEEAFKSSKPYAIERIFELFPVITSTKSDIIDRGPLQFSFAKKIVQSDYTEDQMLAFGDEALGQVYIKAPKNLSADVVVDDKHKVLKLVIKNKLEMQVNKLAEQGLNRSAFQQIRIMRFHEDIVVTTLTDSVSESKITNLVVYLNKNNLERINQENFKEYFPVALHSESTVLSTPLRTLDTSDCVDGLFGGDGKWLVYCRRGETQVEGGALCEIGEMHCNFPGKDYEVLKDGFNSEQDARAWKNTTPLCVHDR